VHAATVQVLPANWMHGRCVIVTDISLHRLYLCQWKALIAWQGDLPGPGELPRLWLFHRGRVRSTDGRLWLSPPLHAPGGCNGALLQCWKFVAGPAPNAHASLARKMCAQAMMCRLFTTETCLLIQLCLALCFVTARPAFSATAALGPDPSRRSPQLIW
jgi:hypothetical protein